jgi:hypothetical protein
MTRSLKDALHQSLMFRKLLPLVVAPAVSLLLAASASGAGFGVQSFEASAVNRDGSPDVQAGSHPYALITSFTMNESEEKEGVFVATGGTVKDVHLALPPGFVGNPNAVPKCSSRDFLTKVATVSGTLCPDSTAVGVATIGLGNPNALQGREQEQIQYVTDPVYNLEPAGGLPAELGIKVASAHPVFLNASVRTGSDYGITVASLNITEAEVTVSVMVKVWGVPADPSHDSLRGNCLAEHESLGTLEEHASQDAAEESLGVCPADIPVRPFLTNPTSCGESREAKLSVDGWNEPGNFVTGENVISRSVVLPVLSGCEELDFSPSLSVQPDGTAGSTPTGLNVGVGVSQESTSNPEGLGEADVKDTTVTLPQGMQLSPAAADGLQSCSDEQIGFTGANATSGVDEFTPVAPSCPDASKIANVRIATPLLEHELTGAVYLAAPQNFVGLPQNPFSSLIAMYLVAEEPETGVLVKLPGRVSLSETGQITTTFENTPQLPFSELKLEFYGTDRAPLATPAQCGIYSTQSSFVPWSAEPTVSPPAAFQITSGPHGSPCASPLGFSPTLTSGMTNINAGGFSSLTTTLGREDGQQNIQSVVLHYPPGVTGVLAGVPLCGEEQANAGTCPGASEIGETTVSVGLGDDPYTVTGGKAYLTGPYDGAPFGLSIVNPAAAGPFVLQEGRPVVVRASVQIDPHTAALTVSTDSTGPHAIPQFIEGIPLQIKHVNVLINRPGFTLNPTSCNPVRVTGTVNSAESASAPVSIPFQIANCAALRFSPMFVVSTSGKTSKADGASLTATVEEPTGALGTQANIARVKVELPKQLPARLTTLQKACTQGQFQENPAGCPAASVIGHATVRTPLLPVALEGPAYFVSNGGEAFPNLIMVLQGYGVTIDLIGDTFISKAGVTSTTFKTIPDQPFNSFELTLPEGPYSALAANGNMCALTKTVTVKKKVTIMVRSKGSVRKRTVTRNVKQAEPETLRMPTEFVGQNGVVSTRETPVMATGCPKAKQTVTSKKHAKGRKTTAKKQKKK